jgi:hypothetical protein
MTAKHWIVVALATVTLGPIRPRVAHADTYAWTDEQGAKHLTDRLSAVPERFRDKVVRVGGAPSAPAAPTAPSAPARGSAAGTGSATSPGGGSDEIFKLGEAPVARTPVPPAASAPAAPAEPETKTDSEGHDKVWWQTQMAAALNRQSRAADEVRTLDANKIVLHYGQPADRTKYRNDVAKARKELDDANKALEGLQKHGKSAGADPSWMVLPGMEASSNKKTPETSNP